MEQSEDGSNTPKIQNLMDEMAKIRAANQKSEKRLCEQIANLQRETQVPKLSGAQKYGKIQLDVMSEEDVLYVKSIVVNNLVETRAEVKSKGLAKESEKSSDKMLVFIMIN